MKNRIEKYGFIENQDFASFDNIVKREKGATVQKEYALSIDCAKEIPMVYEYEKVVNNVYTLGEIKKLSS